MTTPPRSPVPSPVEGPVPSEPRRFTLKDETTISGHRDRGRFLRGLSEEDWPAVVPVPVELGDGGADLKAHSTRSRRGNASGGERVVPAPYDAAAHEAARNGWWLRTFE